MVKLVIEPEKQSEKQGEKHGEKQGEIQVVAIAAVARNGVIGADADIPWRIAADWRRFKAITMNQVLIMGRKTFDSIGRPLPGRHTVCVTRDPSWRHDGVLVAPSVPAALRVGGHVAREVGAATIFVAGGGEIYRAAWPWLSALEITEVDAAPVGDVTFPEIAAADWRSTTRESHDGFSFVTYARRSPAAALPNENSTTAMDKD